MKLGAAFRTKPDFSEGGVRRHRPRAVDQLVDAPRRDADALGETILADAQRAEKLLQEDLAGMDGRKLLRHGWLLG